MSNVAVLDKGYVRLVDTMGSDLSVVNAARASYMKESREFSIRDQALLDFLVREGHTSPFRHAIISLEVYAPLMVARQWYKYVVGSHHTESDSENDWAFAWNESSRRYITEEEEFYLPQGHEWRSKPANSKQGSGAPLDATRGRVWTQALDDYQKQGLRLYKSAIDSGVAPEQARLFLPAYGLYVRWRWTTSLAAVVWFLKEREAHDAQSEIRDFANAVREVVGQKFPASMHATRSA